MTDDFELSAADEQVLMAAIRELESRTTAELRVCVCYQWLVDVEGHGWAMFERLQMRQTRERNAALILVVPRNRQLAVMGDVALDQRVGPEFWRETVAAMAQALRREGGLAGLLTGVGILGEVLERHWPQRPGVVDVNELPDEILREGIGIGES